MFAGWRTSRSQAVLLAAETAIQPRTFAVVSTVNVHLSRGYVIKLQVSSAIVFTATQ
jgi:hypothetical protein